MVQNLTYTQYGDYYIPDIRLAHMGIHTLGKYGRMRRAFLEQNKPMLLMICLDGNSVPATCGKYSRLVRCGWIADE